MGKYKRMHKLSQRRCGCEYGNCCCSFYYIYTFLDVSTFISFGLVLFGRFTNTQIHRPCKHKFNEQKHYNVVKLWHETKKNLLIIWCGHIYIKNVNWKWLLESFQRHLTRYKCNYPEKYHLFMQYIILNDFRIGHGLF